MFLQYDTIADLLLPTEQLPKQKPIPQAMLPTAEPQPQLNFGE
jgi:hypothetical protein